MTIIGVLLSLLGASEQPVYEASIQPYNGRQTIFINGKPEAAMIYCPVGKLSNEPWRPEAREYLGDFAGAGYRIFQCEVWMSSLWKPEGIDTEHVRRQLRTIREVRSDAAVILRIFVDAPGWWVDQHPDDRLVTSLEPAACIPDDIRQKPGNAKNASPVSETWRRETAAQLAKLLGDVAASPEGGALIGVHVCGGEWGEWFYSQYEFEPDAGPAMTKFFRGWLERKYGDDAALQKAWGDSVVTLATAEVPRGAERLGGSERMFRDPQQQARVIDYYRCHHEAMAETPLYFCKLIKETWPRPILAGTFHAYLLHITHQAAGGHLEMQRVLESPYVDYLSSPFSYEFNSRFMGGSGHFRAMMESVRAHGKLWISENDHPTLVGDNFRRPLPFRPENIEDSIATMRRNVAHVYTLGQGQWWCDFGPGGDQGNGGWWADPRLMEETAKDLRLAQKLMETPYESTADVLFVYDTECFYYLPAGYINPYWQSHHWNRTDTLSFEALNETIGDAYKSGVSFDTVLLHDLDIIDLSRYKVIVFGFTPYLSEADAAFINAEVVTPGRTVVWVYAPGYTDGKALYPERIGQVVGMEIAPSLIALAPELLLREGSLSPDFPETRVSVTIKDAWTSPTFQVTDRNAQTMGYYGASRQVALARKDVNGTQVWYCALPLKNPRVMREIFRAGGAHVYNEKNDVFHAGGGVVCLHTETGGPRTLTYPDGRTQDLMLDPWSTVILDYKTGEALLK